MSIITSIWNNHIFKNVLWYADLVSDFIKGNHALTQRPVIWVKNIQQFVPLCYCQIIGIESTEHQIRQILQNILACF